MHTGSLKKIPRYRVFMGSRDKPGYDDKRIGRCSWVPDKRCALSGMTGVRYRPSPAGLAASMASSTSVASAPPKNMAFTVHDSQIRKTTTVAMEP